MGEAEIKLERRKLRRDEGDVRDSDREFVSTSFPAFHLFSALTEQARSLVVEHYYFDLDTRSEVAELQETRFVSMTPYATRFHFFADAPRKGQRLRDFVLEASESYIGYAVIRSQLTGRIGRAMVPAKTSILDDTGKLVLRAEIVERQTRTAAIEQVNLFGVNLTATGVPFMEQDGSLLRCAHISSWICHYTAVLRYAVPRRPTAHFHRNGDSHRALGRRYPSIGLTIEEMASMLRKSDLPPERLDREALRASRRLSWADSRQLHARHKELKQLEKDCAAERQRVEALAQELDALENVDLQRSRKVRRDLRACQKAEEQLLDSIDEFWIRENTVAALCRYANSGIPTILVRQGIVHTQVVVGYLRAKDLTPDGTGSPQVVSFIVSDDAEGPFRLVDVDDLVSEIAHGDTALLVPLPHSLWMSGGVAEKIATKLVAQAAKLRSSLLPNWSEVASGEQQHYGEVLADLTSEFDPRRSTGKYTLHVFATTGVDLKQSVAARLGDDPEFVRSLASLQLPKYVWVGEVLDRAVHDAPSVKAMIVIDATQPWAHSLDEPEGLELLPLFVHLPGHIQATPYAYGFASVPTVDREPDRGGQERYWSKGTFQPYPTGRWNKDRLAEHSASHGKLAVVTE